MVEYDSNRCWLVTDMPEWLIDNIEENVKMTTDDAIHRQVNHADDKQEAEELARLEVKEAYIIGSWARGTAIKGESDIDILQFIEDRRKPTLTLKQRENISFMTVLISNAMANSIELYTGNWYDGFDVKLSPHLIRWTELRKFTRETRDERPLGKPQVYSLKDRQFVTKGQLEQLVETQPPYEEILDKVGDSE